MPYDVNRKHGIYSVYIYGTHRQTDARGQPDCLMPSIPNRLLRHINVRRIRENIGACTLNVSQQHSPDATIRTAIEMFVTT